MAKNPVSRTRNTAKSITPRTRKLPQPVKRPTAKHNPDQQDMLHGSTLHSMASRYPKYYRDVSADSCVDVYRIHQLYEVNDMSGCLQHASKKILLSGVRTGGKAVRVDIEEARDTLTRWLELHP